MASAISASVPLPAIRDLIRTYGLSASKKFSQNFILDKKVTDKIVQHAKVSERDDLIVEVGPGPGLLTRSILDAGAPRVVVVEKDLRFKPALEQLADASDNRLHILLADMLTVDHADICAAAGLDPADLICANHSSLLPHGDATIATTATNKDKKRTIRVMGNLPFGVATPLLVQWLKAMASGQGLFAHSNNVSLTLMFQKEVAERIVAKAHHPQRSRMSILSQAISDPKLIYKVPSGVFVPKPKVDAAVVHFERKETPLVPGSLDQVEDVARYFFTKRRKTVGHILNRLAKDAPETQKVLEEVCHGWDRECRPTDVDTALFCALATKLEQHQLKIPLS